MKNKLLAIAAFFFFTFTVSAQDEIDIKLSSTYAIQNAHIVQKPGQSIDMGTVIIKDGVITSVGKNVTIPPEAIMIKADSMFVYPGFIDAYNNTGVKKEEEKRDEERVKDPGNPPNDRAGIMPDRKLSDVFEGGEKSIGDWREAGFTAAHSAPSGGMLPGTTSLILLSGKDASQSILKENVGMLGTFESANRMYPATIIGVMAKYRDLFRQSGYAEKHEKAYQSSPVGMARPSYDKSIKALIPVANKSQVLFFEAEKIKDISRAIELQKDLGFNIALVNVKQGSEYLDLIKSQKIPVVLSMEVPESDEKKKKDKEEAKDSKEADDKKEAEEEKEEEIKKKIDPEMEALKARREEAIVDYQSQAAILAKNGVAFGLSGKDIKGKDLKKNLNLMKEHGITEDQLLAALTTNPAQMLGVSNIMGSVEQGKMANLVVTTGPYFEEDSKIKYVFVEGEQFEYEIKKKKKAKSGEASARDMSGVYAYTIEIPGQAREGTITMKKSGDSYTVLFGNEDGDNEEVDAVVEGNRVTFPYEANNDGFTIKLKVDFTVEDEEIEGSVVAGQFGSFPLSGERVGDPE